MSNASALSASAPSRKPWWLVALGGGLLTAVPVVLIGLVVMYAAPTYMQNIAATAAINMIIVIGLQVFMGNSGVAHLGHSAFVGLGAYGMAILATPVMLKKLSIPNAPFGLGQIALSPPVAIAITFAVVAIIAIASGRVIARLSGIAATIVSLAFLIIVHSMFLHWPALFKGNQGFFGIPQVAGLSTILACVVAAILIARLFRESPNGLQLRASAQNPMAAEALAIDARALRWQSWVLSALICASAGMLYALFAGTISPRIFYFQQVFMTLAMLILGGIGTVTGAVVGTLILSIGLEAIRSFESGVTIGGFTFPAMLGLSGVALGAVVVFSMALRPQGICGMYELDEMLARLLRRTRGGK